MELKGRCRQGRAGIRNAAGMTLEPALPDAHLKRPTLFSNFSVAFALAATSVVASLPIQRSRDVRARLG